MGSQPFVKLTFFFKFIAEREVSLSKRNGQRAGPFKQRLASKLAWNIWPRCSVSSRPLPAFEPLPKDTFSAPILGCPHGGWADLTNGHLSRGMLAAHPGNSVPALWSEPQAECLSALPVLCPPSSPSPFPRSPPPPAVTRRPARGGQAKPHFTPLGAEDLAARKCHCGLPAPRGLRDPHCTPLAYFGADLSISILDTCQLFLQSRLNMCVEYMVVFCLQGVSRSLQN